MTTYIISEAQKIIGQTDWEVTELMFSSHASADVVNLVRLEKLVPEKEIIVFKCMYVQINPCYQVDSIV